MEILGIVRTTVQKNITYLREHDYIEHVGANKNEYWKVLR